MNAYGWIIVLAIIYVITDLLGMYLIDREYRKRMKELERRRKLRPKKK